MKKNILLVEDNLDNLSLLRDVVEASGDFSVMTATDGQDALELLEQFLPDLIITDLSMPRLNGWELIPLLRDNPRYRHIPILICTAHSMIGDRERGLKTGADDYITKPVNYKDFFEKTNHLLTVSDVDNSIEISEVQSDIPVHQKAIKILTVEDERDIRELIAFTLQFAGYEVLQASNGLAGLALVESYMPDLVLVDVRMPIMTGHELVRILRMNPAMRHIGLIFLTAMGQKEEEQLALEAGGDDFLRKPFAPEILTNYLENYFARRIALAPQIEARAVFIANGNLRISEEIGDLLLDAGITVHYPEPDKQFWSIAFLRPSCVILWQAPNMIERFRRFQLTANRPIVLVVEQVPNIMLLSQYYALGADEICTQNQLANAILLANRQYERPTLVETGRQWDIVVASSDDDIRSQVKQNIEKTFYAEHREAISQSVFQQLCLDKEPTLIILDETLGDWVTILENLRRELIESPIILICEALTEEILLDGYRMGVRGYLPKQISEDVIIQTIERLLRWGIERKSTAEIWSDYRLDRTELEFESRVRPSSIATIIDEIAVLYSGLIHDIRNVFYSINSQLSIIATRSEADSFVDAIADLQKHIQHTKIWLEFVANLRFKGAWRPKEYHSEQLVEWIKSAKELVKLTYARFDFSIENTLKNEISLVVDDDQVLHTLFIVLLFMAENNAKPNISLSMSDHSKMMISISANGITKKQLEQFTKLGAMNAYPYVLQKLTLRHSWSIKIAGRAIQLEIPPRSLSNEDRLRIEVAHDATVIDSLKSKMPVSTKQGDVSITAMVREPLEKLVQATANLIPLTQQFGEQNKRLELTARYGLLLVRNMLVTAANIKQQTKPINIHTMFHVATELQNNLLRECDVDISIADGTAPVLADELSVLQILTNLITNAVEAMDGEGELHLRAEPHPNGVLITIQDSGQGIPKDKIEQIFKLFYTTKSGHERGVGLHIVSSIVNELKGQISVESEIGKGTSFRIVLPAHIE